MVWIGYGEEAYESKCQSLVRLVGAETLQVAVAETLHLVGLGILQTDPLILARYHLLAGPLHFVAVVVEN